MEKIGVIRQKALEPGSVAVIGNSVSFGIITIKEIALMGQQTLKKHCNFAQTHIVSQVPAWW